MVGRLGQGYGGKNFTERLKYWRRTGEHIPPGRGEALHRLTLLRTVFGRLVYQAEGKSKGGFRTHRKNRGD